MLKRSVQVPLRVIASLYRCSTPVCLYSNKCSLFLRNIWIWGLFSEFSWTLYRTTLLRSLQRQTPQDYALPLSSEGQAYILTYFLLRYLPPMCDQAYSVQLGQPTLYIEVKPCGLFSCSVFQDTVSLCYSWLSWNLLCRSGWPQTHRDPPVSASCALGLNGQ